MCIIYQIRNIKYLSVLFNVYITDHLLYDLIINHIIKSTTLSFA